MDPQYTYLDYEKPVTKDNELMPAVKDEGAVKGGASKPPTPPKEETQTPKWDLPAEQNPPSEKLQPSTNPKL